MPAAVGETPSVALSFANNFWGKDDAGVGPLLERMHGAKQTSDELRSFYNARASIEDEYARKLLSLCRKSLGSQEMGSLKQSLDVVRGEVEAMAKQHQAIAAQMKSELEEPLAAFAGAMKERRKIVQNGIEKLLKVKIQQTQAVNKTRDRYEQECLKIKGYLAQGHMVMGQEERKNKAKLEKTQISLATSNAEYESAVKALEETTARWNREWKAAADKFQDLEEERLDFTKSSLWTLANIASTVCVSDDASCEKIRLSLEKMDVEKDIATFIHDRGTGQEIPDPPKYINFCRGDANDTQSEVSDDGYSVAQFPRSINPAFRSSSPQPSTYESHHDPNSSLAQDLGHGVEDAETQDSANTLPPQAIVPPMERRRPAAPDTYGGHQQSRHPPDMTQHGPFAAVPHDPYPLDGMTMLCRTNPFGPPSERSSQPASARPSSRDSQSDYSNPTSMSSQEMHNGSVSPAKQHTHPSPVSSENRSLLKKKSGFFQTHSPFRRKSTRESPSNSLSKSPWQTSARRSGEQQHTKTYTDTEPIMLSGRTNSPDPIDANASLALNVGENVFSVTTPDLRSRSEVQEGTASGEEETDVIALALAELKGVGVGKPSAGRISADRYHGIATPAPIIQSAARPGGTSSSIGSVAAGLRGTPPPSYDQPTQRLGVPPQAVTSKAMKEASQKFVEGTRNLFSSGASTNPGSYGRPQSRPGTRGSDLPRAASPAPLRSSSPRPVTHDRGYRSASPNPYGGAQRTSSQFEVAPKRGSDQGYYHQVSQRGATRTASPQPREEFGRPASSHAAAEMSIQLAPTSEDGFGSQRGRGAGRPGTSSGARGMALYEGSRPASPAARQRSKSVADPSRQYTRDGRPIIHFARAMFSYQAQIPEELGFSKGDLLAVLRHQDDGWWEAEVQGGSGRSGLVPSNYLDPIRS